MLGFPTDCTGYLLDSSDVVLKTLVKVFFETYKCTTNRLLIVLVPFQYVPQIEEYVGIKVSDTVLHGFCRIQGTFPDTWLYSFCNLEQSSR